MPYGTRLKEGKACSVRGHINLPEKICPECGIPTDRLVIVGGAETWFDAPMEGEVWGLNVMFHLRPVSMAVETHDYDWTQEECIEHQFRHHAGVKEAARLKAIGIKRVYRNQVFRRQLKIRGIPLLSKKKYDDLPNSIEFPLEEIKKKFNTDFYGNVACYAIAYGLHLGYRDFHLYGIRMHNEWEYFQERDSVSFWLGIAIGTGASVTIHDPDPKVRLLSCHTGCMYAYPEIKQEIHIGD